MSYQFNNKLVAQLGEKMARGAVLAAGTLLQREVKERLNLGKSPPASIAPNGPFKDTGTLGRSIQVDDSKAKGKKPSVRVGTSLVYAARLEFGFVGADSRGRVFNQGARPYMRDSLNNNVKEMRKAAINAANDVFKKFVAQRGGR
jgi:phage gpG-like protein